MDKAPLKLQLPSDIAAAFCASLLENGIKYSVRDKKDSGPELVVNSQHEAAKEIIIEIINSGPFWASLSAGVIAYIKRHKGKKLTIERDGTKFTAENMSHHDMNNALENAKNIIFREEDKDKDVG